MDIVPTGGTCFPAGPLSEERVAALPELQVGPKHIWHAAVRNTLMRAFFVYSVDP
jgi:hypothetical protein